MPRKSTSRSAPIKKNQEVEETASGEEYVAPPKATQSKRTKTPPKPRGRKPTQPKSPAKAITTARPKRQTKKVVKIKQEFEEEDDINQCLDFDNDNDSNQGDIAVVTPAKKRQKRVPANSQGGRTKSPTKSKTKIDNKVEMDVGEDEDEDGSVLSESNDNIVPNMNFDIEPSDDDEEGNNSDNSNVSESDQDTKKKAIVGTSENKESNKKYEFDDFQKYGMRKRMTMLVHTFPPVPYGAKFQPIAIEFVTVKIDETFTYWAHRVDAWYSVFDYIVKFNQFETDESKKIHIPPLFKHPLIIKIKAKPSDKNHQYKKFGKFEKAREAFLFYLIPLEKEELIKVLHKNLCWLCHKKIMKMYYKSDRFDSASKNTKEHFDPKLHGTDNSQAYFNILDVIINDKNYEILEHNSLSDVFPNDGIKPVLHMLRHNTPGRNKMDAKWSEYAYGK